VRVVISAADFFFTGGIDRRSREIMTLIDYVVNKPAVASTFHLNTSKIHIFGHSFGGGTCASVACRDPRITSCVMRKKSHYVEIIAILC
jgi:predicted alpha/beta superfamily hydrolase